MRRAALSVVLLAGLVPAVLPACSKNDKKSETVASAAPPPSASAAPLVASASRKRHDDRHEAADDAGAPLKLDVKIGSASSTWSKDAFAKAPRFAVGTDGEGRDVWSLRDLARTLVGPTAHVVAIVGPKETRRLDAAAWSDAARTPILHTTRRGTLKFRWADKDGKWDAAEVVDVSRIEIEL